MQTFHCRLSDSPAEDGYEQIDAESASDAAELFLAQKAQKDSTLYEGAHVVVLVEDDEEHYEVKVHQEPVFTATRFYPDELPPEFGADDIDGEE